MDRQVSLTLLKAGINRLRTKGSANVEHAYDLVNCHITEKGTVVPRPGTERIWELPEGTVGLTAFNGCLHVFASESISLSQDTEIEGDDWVDLVGSTSPPNAWDGDVFDFTSGNSLSFPEYDLQGETELTFRIVIVTPPSSGEVWLKYAYDPALLGAFEEEIEITESGDTVIEIVGSPTSIGFGIADFSGGQIQENGLGLSDGEVTIEVLVAGPTPDPCIELDVLVHPSDPDAALTEIHFAKPFLGALYVVAEFDSGEIFDYWLQQADEWESATEYSYNEYVSPSTANGFVYRATRYGQGYPKWSPGVLRTVGNGSSVGPSIIEPTVYNEYYYTAIDTEGDNPRSGTVEPDWPEADGATIIENTDGFEASTSDEVSPPSPPGNTTPQGSTTERYS